MHANTVADYIPYSTLFRSLHFRVHLEVHFTLRTYILLLINNFDILLDILHALVE